MPRSTPNIGALPLLVGFILVIVVLDIIMPGVMPKWAIFAPIFIPLFYSLGIAPQTVLAAYRVGDWPINVDHAADGLPAVHRPGLPSATSKSAGHRHGGRR